MVIGFKDSLKLFGISIIACCAVFVCTMFLNYNIDLAAVKDQITTPQGIAMYDALRTMGKFTSGVTGGCLIVTSVIMLIFYVKNYIDTHGKELGILKALGYSKIKIASHFWVFGLSVFIGCLIGYIASSIYMPKYYDLQNLSEGIPTISPQFHLSLALCLIGIPTLLFIILSVAYAVIRLGKPPLTLIKELQDYKLKISKKQTKETTFLRDLKKNTLRSRKILVFFVAFSAFCFSAMTQMSISMNQFASDEFAAIMVIIGLILAFVTLLLSLTSVIKANTKTIAMMKVFGYSQSDCSKAILYSYRPVAYIGFVIGTGYQYGLMKIMLSVVYKSIGNVPDYNFDFKGLVISLVAFIITYELVMYYYSRKISKLSVKSVMLE